MSPIMYVFIVNCYHYLKYFVAYNNNIIAGIWKLKKKSGSCFLYSNQWVLTSPLQGHHPATLGSGSASQPGVGTGLELCLSLEHLRPWVGVKAAGQGQHSLCSQRVPVYPASHRHCPVWALQLPSLLLQLQAWAQSGPQRPRSQATKTQQEIITGVYPRTWHGHSAALTSRHNIPWAQGQTRLQRGQWHCQPRTDRAEKPKGSQRDFPGRGTA